MRERKESLRSTARTAGRALTVFLFFLSAPRIAAAGSSDGEREAFERVVQFHVERYPAMEAEDLYKLVYQAAMGSEHAVPSRQAAREWLELELAGTAGERDEDCIEPLSPDGSLVRINLRAFLASGDDPERLLSAFIATATESRGSRQRLLRYWGYVEGMAQTGRLPFEAGHLHRTWQAMEARGFPAVHHSRTYRDSYEPAYRVVLHEFLDEVPAQATAR